MVTQWKYRVNANWTGIPGIFIQREHWLLEYLLYGITEYYYSTKLHVTGNRIILTVHDVLYIFEDVVNFNYPNHRMAGGMYFYQTRKGENNLNNKQVNCNNLGH